MMEKSAPVPQTAFARVNQSARWNSRIMENGFFGLPVFTGCTPVLTVHAWGRGGRPRPPTWRRPRPGPGPPPRGMLTPTVQGPLKARGIQKQMHPCRYSSVDAPHSTA
jgi:hypothetical protein